MQQLALLILILHSVAQQAWYHAIGGCKYSRASAPPGEAALGAGCEPRDNAGQSDTCCTWLSGTELALPQDQAA